MRIQIPRVDMERLLLNAPNTGGNSIGIDTDDRSITVIDGTGRERGSVQSDGMEIIDRGAGWDKVRSD